VTQRNEIDGWTIYPFYAPDEPTRILFAVEIVGRRREKYLLTLDQAREIGRSLHGHASRALDRLPDDDG
jgi:hypothetical protein